MLKHLIFTINGLLALLTLILFGVKHIPPSQQFFLAGATLFLPALIVIQFLFIIYWLVRLNKKVFLSITVLLIGYKSLPLLFAFNFNKKITKNTNIIKLASYNARYFKNQNFVENKEKNNNCFALLGKKDIKVLGLQEISAHRKNKQFPYSNYDKQFSQSWVYSKYPIIKGGTINVTKGQRKDFTYADILFDKDTLRVYNAHFHSYRFPKKADKLQKRGIKNLINTTSKVFTLHEQEVDKLIKHIKSSPYPVIVMGDFNNNTYSYEYNQLIKKCNLKDTFVEAGFGFGATFDFKYFPTRIDYILVPKNATVYSHKVIKTKNWSDHYPIVSEISL